MSTPEQIEEVLELLNQCQTLAAETGNACFENQTALRGLAGNFIARAARLLPSERASDDASTQVASISLKRVRLRLRKFGNR